MQRFQAALDEADPSAVGQIVDQFAEELLVAQMPETDGEARRGLRDELARALHILKPASKALSEARLKVCETCDQAQRIALTRDAPAALRCRVCGCLMNFKVRLQHGACPAGKFS